MKSASVVLVCLVQVALSAVSITSISPSTYLKDIQNASKHVPSYLDYPTASEPTFLKNGPGVLSVMANQDSKQRKTSEDGICDMERSVVDHIRSYQGVVNQIINYVTNGEFSGRTFDKLAELTDTFGHRMTGSEALENAVDWTIAQFKEEGISDVRTENFSSPHWVRNTEALVMLYPRIQKINFMGLGSSVGTTDPDGIKAQILVVKSFKEFDKYSKKANGKIVVFNADFTGYGETVKYRTEAASRASKHGAFAVLIRSITPFSINSAHTGWQHYAPGVKKIPSGCITVEDAEMLQRFQDRGTKVFLHLKMEAKNLPPVVSRNTVGQLTGTDKPQEVVVVSGHLDSWDVGVGAMDDGGGSMVSWSVPVILKKLDLKPRRTLRTVLFTGEEQGLHGGQAYYEKHHNGSEKFQLLLESDSGTFKPLGISFNGPHRAKCIMKEVLALMTQLNATKLSPDIKGAPDISFWKHVPTGGLLNENERYFWFHHSEGDTMAVEDPVSLDACAALWAAVSYVVADMNISLLEH